MFRIKKLFEILIFLVYYIITFNFSLFWHFQVNIFSFETTLFGEGSKQFSRSIFLYLICFIGDVKALVWKVNQRIIYKSLGITKKVDLEKC